MAGRRLVSTLRGMQRARRAVLLGSLAGLSCLWATACAKDPGNPALRTEIAKLARDTKVLAEAVDAANAGTLLQPENVLIGIHQNAVATLMESALPLERKLPGLLSTDGVTVRIDRIQVLFDGGLGTVRVDGWAKLTHLPKVAAGVHLSGGFFDARVDPEKKLLVATATLDALEATPLPGGLLSKLLRGALLRALNAHAARELTRAIPRLELPIKLEQRVTIPNFTEDPLHVPGGRLPIAVTFTRMLATNERLWLELKLSLGKWQRAEQPR